MTDYPLRRNFPQVNDSWGAVRAGVRGVPIAGGLMDEVLAAGDATFGGAPGKSWSERWNSAVESQRAYDAAYDRDHPVLSALLQTAGGLAVPGGVVLGTATKAAKGIGMIGRHLPQLLPRSAMGRRMLVGAAEGAVVGGIDGAARSEGGDRLSHGITAMALNSPWGALRPRIARRVAGDAMRQLDGRATAKAAEKIGGMLEGIEAHHVPLAGLIPLPDFSPHPRRE